MKEVSRRITSLEIAELTGKPHNDLMKAIRKMEKAWVKIGEGNFSQSSYINSQNKRQPCYSLTKTECLYIATKFNDEARAKLVLRWEELETKTQQNPLSQIDLIIQSAQALKESQERLAEHDNRLALLEAKATTRPEYFTVAGYGSLVGVPLGIKLASSLGRKATKVCKDRGLVTETIPDPRFGVVKTYPKQVLEEVFEINIIK